MLSRLFLNHGTDQKSVTNKGHQYGDCVTDDIGDSLAGTFRLRFTGIAREVSVDRILY